MAARNAHDAVHLVSYATHRTEALSNWMRSAAEHGWPAPAVLGLGEVWRGDWAARAATIAEHIFTLPVDDLVLVTDAYDVIIMQPPEVFVAVVGSAAVLLGTERSLYTLLRAPPRRRSADEARQARSRGWGVSARLHASHEDLTINGGAFAGRALAVATALRGVAASRCCSFDDQAAWAALADDEERCPGLSSSDFVFDSASRLVCNLSVCSTWPDIFAFALAPRSYVRRAYAEARRRGCVCIHALGSRFDRGVRYSLLLQEAGLRESVGIAPLGLSTLVAALLLAILLATLWACARARAALGVAVDRHVSRA